ncbi:ATP-binding protein [Legionella dresdenensis]|uniref:histidine kinase n=1 Tax=Legionella dresdenensis TaxID=450200 RepID=A0ABV8CIA9_9GAMM
MSFVTNDETAKLIEEKDKEIQKLNNLLEQERIKFNNQLQDTKDYYENILALMPGHVYWMDRNNTYLGCNDIQAENANLNSPKEIVGKTNFDMPWRDQAEELNRINNLVMETGQPHTEEEYKVTASGTAIFLSHKTPLRNNSGKVIGMLGVSIDVTNRKKMEVALRRAKESVVTANQAKAEFLANMSHDLRTPLSGIVGLSKLLEERAQDGESKQFARWINESGVQLLELLNGVLDVVTGDQTRESDINNVVFDLRKNIQDIAHLLHPTIKQKNLEFNLEMDDNVPEKVIIDGTKLHRVLLNLLGNALKFTEKGNVTLKIESLVEDNDYVRLQFTVSDTGIGIPLEHQSKIFDRFFRINPSYKDSQNGHGVGLYLAQRYVGLLGGEIKVISEPGEGSVFYFTLSMKIPSNDDLTKYGVNTDTTGMTAGKQLPLAPNSPTILLVEDNMIALRLIEVVVRQARCHSVSAIDAEQAFELVQSRDFDMVITDLGLPGMSGTELARQIREWEFLSQKKPVPLIGLTAHASDSNKLQSLQAGMNKIIEKPIHLNIMLDLVDQYILPAKKKSNE